MSAPTATYIPIATAVPIFANMSASVPQGWNSIPGDVWGVISNTNLFTVRQHAKVLPKNCCKCPPCVKQENTYSVYAGLNQDSQAEFLRVDEVSDDWNRCCCAPYHPVKLEVRPYVPMPGDGSSSDFSHIANDVQSSWNTMTRNARFQAAHDMYMQYPPVMTFIRHDGQRCCCKMPCRWLNVFVCFACCQDGMDVYAGALEDDPKGEKGRPYQLTAHDDRHIGSVQQPNYGGCYRPVLDLTTHGAAEPFAKMEGPCFFGGWSECCCDFNFWLSTGKTDQKGDLGVVTKRKPASLAGAMRELMTEADVYTLAFGNSNSADASAEKGPLSAEQKVTVLASQLLVDYMIFEGNTEKCSQDENFIYCYLCYCMLIGKLCPCYIAIPKNTN